MFRLLLQHFFLRFKFIQLIRSGDIEIQPGPIKNALKFCHWNLNSVLVHDRIKISLLEAYNSVYNYDILVLGETYLSGKISHDETFIEGFSKNPFRKDDPSGLRKGGLCMYFKENLPIKRRVDLETLCAEGIVTEITLHRKNIFCGPLSSTWHVIRRLCSIYATFRITSGLYA